MNTGPIVKSVVVKAPAEKVWQALTDKDQMKQWYFDVDAFEPVQDYSFSFTGNDGTQSFLHFCKIIEVIPHKKLKHTWQYEGQLETTVVTWSLEDMNNQTRVTLEHKGLEKISKYGRSFARKNFEKGWEDIQSALTDYVEKQ